MAEKGQLRQSCRLSLSLCNRLPDVRNDMGCSFRLRQSRHGRLHRWRRWWCTRSGRRRWRLCARREHSGRAWKQHTDCNRERRRRCERRHGRHGRHHFVWRRSECKGNGRCRGHRHRWNEHPGWWRHGQRRKSVAHGRYGGRSSGRVRIHRRWRWRCGWLQWEWRQRDRRRCRR